MENVYALVKRFYAEYGRANIFVARTLVERYLRTGAWRGRSNEELCADWYCIEDFLTVIQRRDDTLARLFIRIDYLALFFRFADAHIDRRPLKRHVEDYFARMRAFLTYLDETGDYDIDLGELDADLEMFYITGRFRLPERVAWEEIEGLTIEDIEEDEQFEMEELNIQLNELLHRIGEYYRRPEYQLDIGRAAMIYTGDLYDMEAYEHASEEEKETFWLRFWDYFFFDYHLIRTDETPISRYSEMEWDNLSYDDREIIRDLRLPPAHRQTGEHLMLPPGERAQHGERLRIILRLAENRAERNDDGKPSERPTKPLLDDGDDLRDGQSFGIADETCDDEQRDETVQLHAYDEEEQQQDAHS